MIIYGITKVTLSRLNGYLFKIIKKGGDLVWVVVDKINGVRSLTSFRQGIYFQEIGFTMHDVMIYQKKNTPFMCSSAYTTPRIEQLKE
ncbi:MAG: hypothetical protein LBU55_01345 [Elusimicrobiota bacterium]|jgi:site-specific DNA-methyltransferase (adenine-specific)|nr:hypothetical protein [Elusimicrobiota bacterium]